MPAVTRTRPFVRVVVSLCPSVRPFDLPLRAEGSVRSRRATSPWHALAPEFLP